ncbi:hypothetical protein IHV84_01010 [Acidovorax sp. IB03]|uniref:hypothetical protein n=1 Tax=Acidovorax sp. IB03 TaxID=2779366 RepID=UPI0018E78F59|nr:hypothetical protein [Acidovorax sp. IB03]MBJ2162551.1 hypothetical protein [Acidovorax sp. IB03]
MVFQDDQNAPDCKDTPALPFPFDARDLAAFMLDGVGAFVADYYGDWEDGPETESLNDIDPSNNYARRAVREAFDAYRQAVKSVGEPDNGDTWRDAMVRELLTPKVEPEPAVVGAAPAQPQAAAPAPVVAESASNAPLDAPQPVTTGDVAHAFDGLRRWNEKAWKDTLGSPPKWLEACIALRGERGKRETRWNPVLIGAALVHNGHAKANSIRARFQTKPQLQDWLEAWKTYEADNFDTP